MAAALQYHPDKVGGIFITASTCRKSARHLPPFFVSFYLFVFKQVIIFSKLNDHIWEF